MNTKKYIIYKITNLINNKIYIGCHKCEDINDDYMGSGVYLKRAQEEYGIENFRKEILEVYNTPGMMFQHEALIVNEEFINRDDVYNIKLGGSGGWDYINKNCGNQGERLNKALTQEQRVKGGLNSSKVIKWRRENIDGYDDWYVDKRKLGNNGFKNKTHTEDSKDKIGKANSINQKGSKNSQFGKKWYMPKDAKDKKVRERFLPGDEPKDWITTTEWSKRKKEISINNSPDNFRLRRKWFTDGVNNYLILPEDKTENMTLGQTRK